MARALMPKAQMLDNCLTSYKAASHLASKRDRTRLSRNRFSSALKIAQQDSGPLPLDAVLASGSRFLPVVLRQLSQDYAYYSAIVVAALPCTDSGLVHWFRRIQGIVPGLICNANQLSRVPAEQ